MPSARLPGLPNQVASEERAPAGTTPYERLVRAQQQDHKWQSEVSLGKRIGFYRIRGDLGSGNFSQVKMAVHQLTRERVAIKILDKSKLDQKTRKMLAHEITTMEAIHHPNVIRLYEVVETYSRLHLVMEYAGGGELFNKITSAGRIPEEEASPLYAQIVAAVAFMHDNNFIHRDIKAENVFFSSPGVVKLGDFGFSTQLTAGREQQLTTFCGSPPYAAPELFRDESYLGAPVDTWALGVLLFFMVTGQMPFKANTVAALKKQILICNYSMPPFVSPACKQLIAGILQLEPTSRLSLQSVSESEFLRGVRMPRSAEVAAAAASGDWDTGSDHELQALEKLEELGISRDLLDEHRDRGSKSAVVGTYRILLHRLERRAASAPPDAQSLAADDAEDGAAGSSGGGVGALAARLRSGGLRARTRKSARSGTSQSRACALL
ncbi:serine/threonine-protein kinase NIM1 isoform X3 [Schistocerca nitens]|uniref:serine/threonine-protein kinase NIM1 isoform X3 n=1 Tax=Schistocerca nitens TaxID=7011 RepID=UPI002118138C|nr:serine/threonine-protein kinase NIM1 isoform X3 [Schistocerca nitens]XP_049807397.1 serine/threonine-protein kinase NIM1 isoform X3 [Schistocerca nitens]XP_049807398.1 serine/threonine-protein kinase NIM1 isoform X3 [Schistocerca nitens]